MTVDLSLSSTKFERKNNKKNPCLCNTFTMHSLGACAAHESININLHRVWKLVMNQSC